MIERQIASPMPIPSDLVVKNGLEQAIGNRRIDAAAPVLDFDEDLIILVPF